MKALTKEQNVVERALARTGAVVRNGYNMVVRDVGQYKGRLSRGAVCEVMTDAMCATAPLLRRPAADPFTPHEPPLLRVTLRRFRTGFEHMLSVPLRNLDRWYVHFLDTDAFKGMAIKTLDLAQHLPVPTDYQDGLSETPFYFLGEAFRISVVRCKDGYDETTDVVSMTIVTPYLPCSSVAYDEFKKADSQGDGHDVLLQYAGLVLARQAGFQIEAVGIDDDSGGHATAELEEVRRRLSGLALRFSDEAIHGRKTGMGSYVLRGEFDMSERETTVGRVSIPMVLRKLRFLRTIVRTGVDYHVKTFGPRAYMVKMPDLGGGWSVYVQVNMDASLQRMAAWFMSQDAMVGPYVQAPFKAIAQDDEMLAQSLRDELLDLQVALRDSCLEVEECTGQSPEAITEAQRQDLNAEAFVRLLRYEGLMLVWARVTEEGTQRNSVLEQRHAHECLGVLLAALDSAPPREREAPLLRSPMVRDRVMRTLYRVCEGVMKRMFDECVRADGENEHGPPPPPTMLLIKRLTGPDHRPPVPVCDRIRLLAILRSCTGVPPDKWWERACAGLKVQTASHLCTTLVLDRREWAAAFPAHLFGDMPAGGWVEEVRRAGGLIAEIRFAERCHEAAKDATKLAAALKEHTCPGISEWDAYALIVRSAAAYAMLAGLGDEIGQYTSACEPTHADAEAHGTVP